MENQQLQIQEQQINESQALVSKNLRLSFDKAAANYPALSQRVIKAMAALSMIQSIDNAEQDKYANDILAKVRTTFNTVQAERMEITKPLNDIIDHVILAEKKISTDAKEAGSEYNRVKALRDVFANKQLAEERKKKADAKLELDQKNEIARVRAELAKHFNLCLTQLVSSLPLVYSQRYSSCTLENINEFEAVLDREILLPAERYEGWCAMLLNVRYNQNLIATEVFMGLVTECQASNSHAVINGKFVAEVAPIVESWKAKIPALREALEAAQKATAEEARIAKEKIDEIANSSLKEQNETIVANTDVANQEIAHQQAASEMENMFDAQTKVQVMAEPTGARINNRAFLNCPEEKIVVVLSELLFHCITHSKYKGIFQRNKSKERKYDADGRPEYVPWLADMLTFYAQNCDTYIEGIEIFEVAKSVTKAAK